MPVRPRNRRAVLLQKARVVAGDYGMWHVPQEHHGAEIWVVAEPPHERRFRTARGDVAEGRVYRRADGLVAQAQYVELLPDFRMARENHPPPPGDLAARRGVARITRPRRQRSGVVGRA